MSCRSVVHFLFAFALLPLGGCETYTPPTTVEAAALLPPTGRTFVLSAPYVVPAREGMNKEPFTLPPGRYVSLYRDADGEYFEAPFSSRPEYLFTYHRGGLYVKNGNPRTVHLFSQDTSTAAYYGYPYATVIGASGRTILSKPLPSSLLSKLKFSS